MLERSNLFNTKSKDITSFTKELELLTEIARILNTEEFAVNNRITIYSEKEDIKYSRTTMRQVESGVYAQLVHKFNSVSKRTESYSLFINMDKVRARHSENFFVDLSEDLDISDSTTNFFIYTVMHEIGHYVQLEELGDKGYLNELFKYKALALNFESHIEPRDVYIYLAIDEKFADHYACRKINKVLKELTKLNPKYLTYLD